MNKYSEIEIETAKRLRDAGYKWLARSAQGSVVAFSCKPRKREGYWLYPSNLACEYTLISGKFTPLFQSIKWEDEEPTYIEDIVSPQILNDAEKKYLSAVIKPFRDRVDFICKANAIEHYGSQRIDIVLTDESIDIALPIFESGTMYKGMKLAHTYTLEELGI